MEIFYTKCHLDSRVIRKDYDCVWRAKARLDETLAKWERDGSHNHCPVPNELLPPPGTLGFRVQRYGILRWEDLFTARQKVALVELERNVNKLSVDNCSTATKEILALAISRFSDDFSALTHWMSRGTPGPTFTEHTLPMGWDFCELAPFDDASWSYWGIGKLGSERYRTSSVEANWTASTGKCNGASTSR